MNAATAAQAWGTRASAHQRIQVLGVIIAGHAVMLWALIAATTGPRVATPTLLPLSAEIIVTNNPDRATHEPRPTIINAVVLSDAGTRLNALPQPPVIEFGEPNEGAVRVPPQVLDAALPDQTRYARQAGLLRGESAFAVLRVEILPGGNVGDVQVDVSSGSRQVDAAAMAYVREIRWIAGRVREFEESMWVRYGVRLAA